MESRAPARRCATTELANAVTNDSERVVRLYVDMRELALLALSCATYAVSLAASDPANNRDEVLQLRDLVRKLERAMLEQTQ